MPYVIYRLAFSLVHISERSPNNIIGLDVCYWPFASIAKYGMVNVAYIFCSFTFFLQSQLSANALTGYCLTKGDDENIDPQVAFFCGFFWLVMCTFSGAIN